MENKKILIYTGVLLFLVLVFLLFIKIDVVENIPQNPIVIDEPYIVGEVYSLGDDAILVSDGENSENYHGKLEELDGNASWLTINKETIILDEDGNALVIKDIEKGEKVEVWITGMVLESYPTQTVATKIIVLKETEEKTEKIETKEGEEFSCFVGGCSGEICSKEKDIASTCEFISGMECLKSGASCENVGSSCQWVLSEESAQCFLDIEREQGEALRSTRIGYLFEKAEQFFEE